MQMQERQAQLKEFEAVINLLDKFDIPDEPKTKMLQQLPTLMPRFSSLAPYLEGATWRGKKEIETEFAVQPGQVIKNPITQEPYPEGTKLKGTARMVNGQPVFSKLASVNEGKDTDQDKLRNIYARDKYGQPFDKLSPKQQTDIQDTVIKKTRTEPSTTIVQQRAESWWDNRKKFEKWQSAEAPIKPEQVMNFVNENGQTPNNDPKINTPEKMSPEALRKQGYKFFNNGQVANAYRQTLIALTQLKRIDDAVEKLYSVVDKGENIANAAKLARSEE